MAQECQKRERKNNQMPQLLTQLFQPYSSWDHWSGKGATKNGLKEVKMVCAKRCFVLGRREEQVQCNRGEWHQKSPKGKLDFHHKCERAQRI
jgi:hypothetical protein